MQTGQKIREYILEAPLGSGGFGEVWLAWHTNLENKVAIKIAFRHLSEDPQFRERFLREARALAKLKHTHIVTVHDFFILQNDLFLVMEYFEGGSLQDRIKKHGWLAINETLQISHEILDALDFAHQKSFIHRDIKPSNILMDLEGKSYLSDFGIVMMVGETRLTGEGQLIGTVEYMSPEQIKNPSRIDHRTDVYSFGCVLYELLTGQPPFGSRDDESSPFTIMDRHINHQPKPLRLLRAEVDEHLEAVVLRALAKDPNDRFDGCAHMARTLGQTKAASVKTSTKKAILAAILLIFLFITGYGLIHYLKINPESKKVALPEAPHASVQTTPPKTQNSDSDVIFTDPCEIFTETVEKKACQKCSELIKKASRMKCRLDGSPGCQQGENNCWSGNGVFFYKNGSCYEGAFLNGKRHGTGTLRLAEGDIFTGEWQNNSMFGQGAYKRAGGQDTNCFVGEFIDNKLNKGLIISIGPGLAKRTE
jgi:serine/threonine-protein kinase